MPLHTEHPATPPPLDSNCDYGDIRAVKINEFLRQLRCSDTAAEEFVRNLGPLVVGVASVLLPENPSTAESVTKAVFAVFNLRKEKLSKRSFAAVWLFQTTLLASRKERKRLRLSTKASTPGQKVIYALNKLPAKLRSPAILCSILQVSYGAAAHSLRSSERKIERRVRLAAKKCQRKIARTSDDASAILSRLLASPPERLTEQIIAESETARPSEPLVRKTISAWRWIKLRSFVKHTLAAIGGIICLLVALGGAFIYLATHGYLTSFFIQMGQRQAFKEFPEMRQPARSWPATEADRAIAQISPPKSSAELYRMTNLWPLTLVFSEREYEKLKPSRIPPVRNLFQNGRIILRNPKAKRSGLAGALGYEFNWTEAQLNFAGTDYGRVGVRVRGNGTYVNSLYGSKQSLKVDLNKFEKGKNLGGVNELNFLNAVVDYSFLHDALAEDLFRNLGAIGPRTAYGYVTIQIEGRQPHELRTEPRGLFVLVENIDADFAEDRFGTKRAPIFKPVTYDLFLDQGDHWTAYIDIYDLKTKATEEQLQRVVDFSKLVTHAPDAEFSRRLPEFLDLEEFAAFVAGHVLLSSYDGFLVNGQNFYVYLDPRSQRFGFVPWDQDHAWGDFGHIGKTKDRENASIWNPAIYEFRFLARVMKDETFRQIYRQKLETALATSFQRDKLYADIDQLAARIRPAVAAESDFRLKRFDQAVSSEWLPGPRDGESEGPKAPVHQIKRFIENRIQSVRDQLDGKSEGVRLGNFR